MADLLNGVVVIENAHVLTGPLAGMMLADLGADVIKIENPQGGDSYRKWDGSEDPISPHFAAVNRGKRSMTLNLRTEEGREIYFALARRADVVIENFRAGSMDARGLGYDSLSKINPKLIYCEISGLGPTGPYKDRPTFDGVAEAMSGMWSHFADSDDPRPVGPAMADLLTGRDAAMATLAALVSRSLTGVGTKVSVTMLTSAMFIVGDSFTRYFDDHILPTKYSRGRISQAYAFTDSDGKPLAVHLSSPKRFWDGLCEAIGRPDMANDPRYLTKRQRIDAYDEILAEMQPIFATRDRDTWLKALEAADVPCAPIFNVAETAADPQVQHFNYLWKDPTSGYTTLKSPFLHEGEFATAVRPVPLSGEHTDEVLGDLGYEGNDIAKLHESGAL